MRTRQITFQDIIEIATELSQSLDSLAQQHEGDVQGELRALKKEAEHILQKLPKVETLANHKGYKFAVIDPETGEVRPATYDEGMRLIMGYKEGNILDIAKKWTVRNGQWTERTDNDGTLFASID